MQEYFEFSLGARVLFKAGLAKELDGVLEELGVQRAFVVADKGVVAAGLLNPVLEGLSRCVEVVGILDDVPANSSVRVVAAGAEAVREAASDVIIAIGGGSPLDTAKGMRLLATYGGTIADYEGYNVIPGRLMPMIAIPTTAGTGSEVTSIAVILDEEEDRKISLVSRYLYPDIAILDPELTLSLPPRLTAATGMDALSHAIETYVSTENNPFSDSLALAAIDMVATHLRDAVQMGSDLEARGKMLLASAMAGLAFTNSLLGVVHAIAHALGGKYHIHHGTLNALILPYAMQFNSAVAPERYVRIAWAMGVHAGGRSDSEVIADGVSAVRTLAADCGLPIRLRDLDVPAAALPELAALSVVEPAIFNNPRSASEEELLELLQAMW
ncbi:MAG: iron-containing alcohol dehydrogenase [Candidatus Viridilinea halotolerans]|uniref:Iron-containing alcohol dehydrogenase n=1 Tax=Candidatus Viridilinea halotolerans TaxID=2491704 RepID=A0A426U0J9_9CHLR|nr:MAG: iron-containing alcohol dehydrogenase [Candidatus Viridilinea halotolerans]